MATAMVGSALNADAKISLEKAMQLKSEGKALTQVLTARQNKSLKALKHAPVSGFHKMMAQKDAKMNARKAPAKVTAAGDNIYGYLGYCDDPSSQPIGYYEFQEQGASLVWEDPFFAENGLSCINVAKVDNKIVGYIQDSSWGMLFGVYYIEYDAETGEPLNFEEQDLGFNTGYLTTFAYNPEDETFYGYGACDGELQFLSAPAAEPFNYSPIKVLEGREMCMSMCYNPAEDAIYGVNLDYEFVKVEADGTQSKIMDLDVPDGATYVTGLVWNPQSNLYYWNINYNDGSSAMATIDAESQTLNIYEMLENGEEYNNLITTDEFVGNPNQPVRPTAGAPEFYKGNLIGIVPFTLPSETKGGDAIVGEVEYTTYLNGEFYSTGTAEVGKVDQDGNLVPTVVRSSFAVPEAGKYSFSMRVKYNGVESSAASASTWVGNDIPVVPTNVLMTSTQVSWDAVTEGIHGGYVDVAAMKYEVKVNGETGETSYTTYDIELPQDQELAAYVAEVRAVCNEFKSDWVTSNGVTAGLGLEVPQYITPEPDQYEISVVLDNNKDGVTWELMQSSDPANPYYIQTAYTYSADVPMDDWYFLPKMKFDDPSKFYSFSMEVALRSTYYPNEFVEVLLCNESNPNGVVGIILDEFSPEGIAYETANAEFRVRQAGDYYIAIHCTSDGDQLGIAARNFVVEDYNITFDSPAAIENIDVTPGENGALEATVEFEMPTLTLGEVELADDTEITVNISTPEDEYKVTGKPGEKISEKVGTVQGDNIIVLQASLVKEDVTYNSPLAKTTVYTGVDVPATPVMTEVEFSPDMLSMTLNWEAVTTADQEGGYVDPDAITYDIYMVVPSIFGNAWALYEQGVEGTSYTYEVEPGAEQEMVQLGVVATNAAGDNGTLTSAMGILGTPYDLPILEDLYEGNLYYQPWIIYNDTYDEGLEASWGLNYTSAIVEGGSDDEFCFYAYGMEGAISRLGTPRFSTKGLANVTFSFDLLKTNMPKTTILADTYGEEPEEIGEISDVTFDESGIAKVSFELPAKYMDKDWVGLYIKIEIDDETQMLALNNISIEGSDAVSTIANNGVKIAGGKGQIVVTGLNGQDVTVANINGAVVAKSAKANNEAIFNLEKGVYVVLAGDKKAKVVVK